MRYHYGIIAIRSDCLSKVVCRPVEVERAARDELLMPVLEEYEADVGLARSPAAAS